VKILTPTPLLEAAAAALGPAGVDVVVVGAAAIEMVLAPYDVAITPTRDVDVVVAASNAAEVVQALERSGLQPSREDHERGFTWVSDDVKVQLVRPFHPFPKPPATGLPSNPAFGMASRLVHRTEIAFSSDPERPRLWSANAACLVALKEAAFGRTRHGDDHVAERDFHDVYLLATHVREDLAADYARAEYEVRARVRRALNELGAGGDATVAAARQSVRLGEAETQRQAEAAVRRASVRAARGLA